MDRLIIVLHESNNFETVNINSLLSVLGRRVCNILTDPSIESFKNIYTI